MRTINCVMIVTFSIAIVITLFMCYYFLNHFDFEAFKTAYMALIVVCFGLFTIAKGAINDER